ADWPVQGIGPMRYNAKRGKYTLASNNFTTNPGTVTVTSTQGGTDTRSVVEKGGGKGKKK
ncbi:MAG: hypothetical protein ACE5MK_12895, partial [Acidobacteriota bacterium]